MTTATRERRLRAGLLVLAIPQLVAGVWARVAPRDFYDTFPGGPQHWVSASGPYNSHLVTDVGAGLAALAVLLLLAAIRPEPLVVQVSLVAWLVFAIPHLLFHVASTEELSTGEAATQVIVLAGAVALPVALLVLARGGARRSSSAVPDR
jgi:hypothetical protein